MMCSFQKPELRQPTFQFPMPSDVPAPDACDSIDSVYRKALDEATHAKVKDFWRVNIEVSFVCQSSGGWHLILVVHPSRSVRGVLST